MIIILIIIIIVVILISVYAAYSKTILYRYENNCLHVRNIYKCMAYNHNYFNYFRFMGRSRGGACGNSSSWHDNIMVLPVF